jgi:hypothetical protein
MDEELKRPDSPGEETSPAPAPAEPEKPAEPEPTAAPRPEPPVPAEPVEPASADAVEGLAVEPALPAESGEVLPDLTLEEAPAPEADSPVADEPPAPPDPEREARKAAFVAESAKNCDELITEIGAIYASWDLYFAELAKGTKGQLLESERALRVLVEQFRERQMTRKDRREAWKRYQQAWAEIKQRKLKASAEARVLFLQKATDVGVALKERGPNAAMNLLRDAQKARAGHVFQKEDWDAVQQAFDEIFKQTRETAGQRNAGFRQHLEGRIAQSRDFLARLEFRAQRIRSRVAEDKRQWETEGGAMRAALLKVWLKEAEEELKRTDEKIVEVRRQVEGLEHRLKKL